MLTARDIQKLLKLRVLPVEGGYFGETYRSKFELAKQCLPFGDAEKRALSTAIYYMLTPDTVSAVHRLRGDEVYHFYLGDPTEMLLLEPNGRGEIVLLGQDIASGMHLQHFVPGGTWQGLRLVPGGKFALMGTTMSPGFDPVDFELGSREQLSVRYPDYAALIGALTHQSSEAAATAPINSDKT